MEIRTVGLVGAGAMANAIAQACPVSALAVPKVGTTNAAE